MIKIVKSLLVITPLLLSGCKFPVFYTVKVERNFLASDVKDIYLHHVDRPEGTYKGQKEENIIVNDMQSIDYVYNLFSYEWTNKKHIYTMFPEYYIEVYGIKFNLKSDQYFEAYYYIYENQSGIVDYSTYNGVEIEFGGIYYFDSDGKRSIFDSIKANVEYIEC